MIKYFKMKKAEIELKFMFYTYLLALAKNSEDIIALIGKLFTELKDTPADELKNKFIGSMAELVHKQAQKEHEKE